MAEIRALDELGDLPLDALLAATAPYPEPADDDELTDTLAWFHVLHHERMAAFDRILDAWPGPLEGPTWDALVQDYESRAKRQNAVLYNALKLRGRLDPGDVDEVDLGAESQ